MSCPKAKIISGGLARIIVHKFTFCGYFRVDHLHAVYIVVTIELHVFVPICR